MVKLALALVANQRPFCEISTSITQVPAPRTDATPVLGFTEQTVVDSLVTE